MYYKEAFLLRVLGIGPDSTKKSDHENRKELLARVSTPKLEEANGVGRQHGDQAWIWMVELYSRSVTGTVFDRGKSPREDTGRSPQEAFDEIKHDMTKCCLVGWSEG